MDIRNGDILVVGSDMYAIKAVSDWRMRSLGLRHIRRFTTLTVSTKRAASASGKISPATSAADHLTGLKSTSVMPMDGTAWASVEKAIGLDKPAQLMQAFVSDETSVVHLILEKKL